MNYQQSSFQPSGSVPPAGMFPQPAAGSYPANALLQQQQQYNAPGGFAPATQQPQFPMQGMPPGFPHFGALPFGVPQPPAGMAAFLQQQNPAMMTPQQLMLLRAQSSQQMNNQLQTQASQHQALQPAAAPTPIQLDVTVVAETKEKVLALLQQLKSMGAPPTATKAGAKGAVDLTEERKQPATVDLRDDVKQPSPAAGTAERINLTADDDQIRRDDMKQRQQICTQLEHHLTRHAQSALVLQQVLPQLLALQSDDSSEPVRCLLVTIVVKSCSIDPRRYLPILLPILQVLLASHATATVQRKVLQATTALVSLILATCSTTDSGGGARAIVDLYGVWQDLKQKCLRLVQNRNDGVRNSTLRFIEQLILTYSNNKPLKSTSEQSRVFTSTMISSQHTLFTAKDIEQERDAIYEMYVKLPSTGKLTITNLTVLVAGLADIARQRSSMTSKAVNALIRMHTHPTFKLSDMHRPRFTHAIKAALLSMIRVESLPSNITALVTSTLVSMGFKDELRQAKAAAAASAAAPVPPPALAVPTASSMLQQPTTTAAMPTPVNDLDNPMIKHILNQLSSLPSTTAADIVLNSFTQFNAPPHVKINVSAGQQMSKTLLHFLLQVHEAAKQAQPIDTAASIDSYKSATQAQSTPTATATPAGTTTSLPDVKENHTPAQHAVIAHANQAFNDRMDAADKLVESATPHLPASADTSMQAIEQPSQILATIPPIPTPELSAPQYEALSRSAFSRIINPNTQVAADIAGAQSVRTAMLCKLAINPTVPIEHTVVVDESVSKIPTDDDAKASFDPPEDAVANVTSTLTSRSEHSSMLSYILSDFQSRYDLTLHWLYALLNTKPSTVTFVSKSNVEAEQAAEEAAELQWLKEHGQYVDDEKVDEEALYSETESGGIDVHVPSYGNEYVDAKDSTQQEAKDIENVPDILAAKAVNEVQQQASPNKRKRDDEDSEVEAVDTKRAKSESNNDDDNKITEPSTTTLTISSSPTCEWSWLTAEWATPEYTDTLTNVLTGLETALLSLEDAIVTTTATTLPPSHLLFTRFVLDLPHYPDVIYECITRCLDEPDRIPVALNTLLSMILLRPPAREVALQMLLSTTFEHDNKDTRRSAITTVTDRLYYQAPTLQSNITEYAESILQAIADRATLEDLPQIPVNIEIPPPVEEQLEELERQAKLSKPAGGKIAAKAVPLTAEQLSKLTAEERLAERDRRDQEAAERRQQEVLAMMKDAERRKKEYERLTMKRQLLIKERELLIRTQEERQRQRDERTGRHIELFIALTSKQPAMYQTLLQVYSRAEVDVQQMIVKLAVEAVKKVTKADDLLQVLTDAVSDLMATEAENKERAEQVEMETDELMEVQPPKKSQYSASESLILHTVHAYIEHAHVKPSADLVNICMSLYDLNTVKDATALLPVLPSLTQDQLHEVMPTLLRLPAETFKKDVIQRLYGKAATPSSITPTVNSVDFLKTVHVVIDRYEYNRAKQQPPTAADDTDKADAVAAEQREFQRLAIAGVGLCIDEKDIYTADVLQMVIFRLMDTRATPSQQLPKLALRTMIQCLVAYPSMKSFLIQCATKLIQRKIWLDDGLWLGWCKLLQMTQPLSIPIAYALPDAVFVDKLLGDEKNNALKPQLIAHARANTKAISPAKLRAVLGDEEADALLKPKPTFPSFPNMPFPMHMQPQQQQQQQQQGQFQFPPMNPQQMMAMMQQFQQQQQQQQQRR